MNSYNPHGDLSEYGKRPITTTTHTIPKEMVKPFEADAKEIYETALTLLLKKHRDYGPKNISQSPGGALNGLRVRMWDKFARINNLIDTGATPENESLRDSFLDLANYAMIAMMVLDNKWPEK